MIDFVKAKRHYIMAIAIMFVVVSLSGPTYSLFLKADTIDDFTYNTGILELEFIEDEQISIQNAFPIIDSEGIKTNPYKLTIKNTGTLPYQFDVKMLSSTEENLIDMRYIKYQVNDGKSNTLYATSNIIASNIILYPEEEITFNIRVWLDISMPNSELGKTFIAQLVTSGESIYRTLDTSGANHPELVTNMLPVYYDEVTNDWKKADKSNLIESYEWYNYDNQKWANVVMINDSDRQIYDITGNNNLKINETRTNNGNYISDEKHLDLKFSNYKYNEISSIFRIKFNDLTSDKIYIMSNDKVSYYYDTLISKFVFQIGDQFINSENYKLETKNWYILGYTYDGNEVKFYINGENISGGRITGRISSNISFKLATDTSFKEISNMEIGDIYIYNKTLNEEEINTNYKTNISILYDSLILGYNDFEPKTLKELYQKSNMGTTIKLEDISSFYVWIPRFKYKLWNVTGQNGYDSYNAYQKGIDIIFEKNTESSGVIKCQNNICYNDELLITKVTNLDNGKFYTHPAFSKENEEVTGFWVSKYEISTNSETCNSQNVEGCLSNSLSIESKPGNIAWRNNYLSNFYQNIQNIDESDNYHMIKNSEWGALTYLAHSPYGLCIEENCKEIGANKTYTSGNNIDDSTTNNMHGVFDLSGSASEFVMSNFADNNKLSLNNSHFGNIEINKDNYDLYQSNSFILGDATKEISLTEGIWYNNYNSFINETNNWLIRGGIGTTSYNGMFYYNATTDTNSEYITTRIVIK